MKRTVILIKALSDHNRVRIINALSEYPEMCACQITELLQVTGATVSRHLGILANAGIVDSRKDGRWVKYSLSDAEPSTRELVDWLRASIAASMEAKRDRDAIKRIMACEPEAICRKQRGEACCPVIEEKSDVKSA